MPPTRPIDGDQLSVVDLESSPATVVQSVTVGPAPAGVAISADGKLVLVVTRTDSAVWSFAVEGKRLRQTGRIALPDKSVPAGVAITPDGKRALVTRDGDHTVTLLAIEGTDVKLAGRDPMPACAPMACRSAAAANGPWSATSAARKETTTPSRWWTCAAPCHAPSPSLASDPRG